MPTKTFSQAEQLTASDTNTYLNNGGLVYIGEGSPATSATINIDNIFTSTYRNYRVVVRLLGSSSQAIYLRFRAGGATLTDNIYSSSIANTNNATTPAGAARSDSYALYGAVYATYPSMGVLEFWNPRVTDYTQFSGQQIFGLGATDSGLGWYQGANKVTTAIDGFQLTTAAAPTITMTYYVYGYRLA